jgi:hypothetical protein
VTATEINRNNGQYWLITTPISNGQHSGFIKALVHKSSHRELVNSLHREYNLVLFGAVIASVLLLYLLFIYFLPQTSERHRANDGARSPG